MRLLKFQWAQLGMLGSPINRFSFDYYHWFLVLSAFAMQCFMPFIFQWPYKYLQCLNDLTLLSLLICSEKKWLRLKTVPVKMSKSQPPSNEIIQGLASEFYIVWSRWLELMRSVFTGNAICTRECVEYGIIIEGCHGRCDGVCR